MSSRLRSFLAIFAAALGCATMLCAAMLCATVLCAVAQAAPAGAQAPPAGSPAALMPRLQPNQPKIAAYFEDTSQLNDEMMGEYMLGIKRQSDEEIGRVCHER